MKSTPWLLVAFTLAACGTDGLVSDPELDPPAGTDAYDPSDGMGEGGGGYYTTTGQVSAGGDASQGEGADESSSAGESTGAPSDCAPAQRLCAHGFTLADDGYGSVEVMGSFEASAWEDGVPMTLEDGAWQASVDLPWGQDVEYRFRLDGTAEWILDPENTDVENDNSVVRALMCEDFTCP